MDGKGFDRVRRTEIGKKNFKLTHFEEVCAAIIALTLERWLKFVVIIMFDLSFLGFYDSSLDGAHLQVEGT